MKRPNILYLHSHDTGRYIQPYGHAISTPHLQRLAEQGILFRQAFCAAPTCSPSRASLLTGQCAHSSGMFGLAHRGFALHNYKQHLQHTLQGNGYYTALIGIQHVAQEPNLIGYDQIWVETGHAEKVAPTAVDFLAGHPPQPFFLSVGFFETHRRFLNPASGDDPRYCLPPQPLPDTPQIRRDMAAFKASTRSLDQGIGAVLAALEANNLANSTLVICTTDHGLAFPFMKCNLTDHGLGVMLIMRGPGGFGGGRVQEAMVSQIDLFPTICELLEIGFPSWLQGKSMMPLIRNETAAINDEIMAEINYHAAYEPQRAVRSQRWKYIRRFDDRHKPVLPNCDDSPSKEVWLHYDWPNRRVSPQYLFDLAFDPNESCNLVGEPAVSPVLDDMRHRLDHWMRATDDPLLFGPVPAPVGARLNDPDSLSPSSPTQVVS